MRVGEPSGLATPSASGAAASVAVERQDGDDETLADSL